MPRVKKQANNFEKLGTADETKSAVPSATPADDITDVQERRASEAEPAEETEGGERTTTKRKKYKRRSEVKTPDVSQEVLENADYISQVVTGGINVLSVNVMKESPLSAEEEKLSSFAVKGYIRKMTPEQFESAPGYVLLGVALLIFGPRLYLMYERIKETKAKQLPSPALEGNPVGPT